MKFIILFLLAFNSYADVKVSVLNSKNGKSYSAKFENLEDADAWVLDNESNLSWGAKTSHTVVKTDITLQMNSERLKMQQREDDIDDIKLRFITKLNDDPDIKPYMKLFLRRVATELKK